MSAFRRMRERHTPFISGSSAKLKKKKKIHLFSSFASLIAPLTYQAMTVQSEKNDCSMHTHI